MIEIKSFKDRKGNKVLIGDTVGYFGLESDMRASGKISRITKAGYHISVYIEGQKHAWYTPWIEKVLPQAIEATETA